MNECLKTFESCIKAICIEAVGLQRNDTINRLIEIVFDQGLVPAFMQSHFSGLRSTLEAGVPTARKIRAWTGGKYNPRSRIHGRIRPSLDRVKHSVFGKS